MHRNRKATSALATISAAVALAVLCACSNSDSTAPEPTSVTATTTEDPAVASSEAATQQSLDRRQQQMAQSRIDDIEATLKTGALDDGLNQIITRYCQVRNMPGASYEVDGLEALYSKYWKAGGHWSRPLAAAAQQQGACPTPPPTTPKGPVG